MNAHKSSFLQNFKFLKTFDNFGIEMKFRINGEESHRTIFGGAIYFIYFLLSFIYVCYNFQKFACREVLNLNTTSKIVSPAPNILFNETNFRFSVGIFQADNFTSIFDIGNDYFEIQILLGRYLDSYNPESIVLKTKFCEFDDFPGISTENFKLNRLDKTICPVWTDELKNTSIFGSLTEDSSQFIDLRINIKESAIVYQNEINKYLLNNPFYGIAFMIDTKIDYDNYTKMYSNYLTANYFFIDPSIFILSDSKISNFLISSDDNIIFPNPTQYTLNTLDKRDIISRSINNRATINGNFRQALISYKFYASNRIYILERSYQKLTDFLAGMTGLLSQIVLILNVIINYTNEQSAYQKILNKIMKYKGSTNYDFDLLSELFIKSSNCENNTKKEINKYCNSPYLNKNVIQDNNNNNQSSLSKSYLLNSNAQLSQLTPSSTPIELKKINSDSHINYSSLKSKNSKIKINSFQFLIFSLPCCNRKLKHDINIIKSTGNKVQLYLDVFTYIKKIKEVETLKRILLNEDQFNIFNLVSKPCMYDECINRDLEQKIRKIKIYNEQMKQILVSYEKINYSRNNKNLDSKLCHLLKEEIHKLKYIDKQYL